MDVLKFYDYLIREEELLRINKSAVLDKIKSGKYHRILLQGPDGLRNQLIELANYISKNIRDVDVLVDGDRNFGACDIPFEKAYKLGVEAIFHFGHTEFPATEEQLAISNKKMPV